MQGVGAYVAAHKVWKLQKKKKKKTGNIFWEMKIKKTFEMGFDKGLHNLCEYCRFRLWLINST